MFIGIEIGGTKLQIVVSNDDLEITQRFRFTVNYERGAIDIQEKIKVAIDKILKTNNVKGIGVGFGGPINWQTGEIAQSFHVKGWTNFNIKHWLSVTYKVPIFVENDANVAALGEAMQGAGLHKNPIFYVTVGSGIGSGLVVDKKIYHGQKMGEAEFGHIRLDKNGTVLQDVCSGWAIDAQIRKKMEDEPKSSFTQAVKNLPIYNEKQGGETKYLTYLLDSDPFAKELLQTVTDNIAFALSHAVHLFHPEIIIIGGGVSLMGEIFVNQIHENLKRYVMDAFQPVPNVVLAHLEQEVVPVGALNLVKINL